MELKQIIAIIVVIVIVGIIVFRNLPIRAKRSKRKQVDDEEKTE